MTPRNRGRRFAAPRFVARWGPSCVLACVLPCGCSRPAPDATPEGAVHVFLDAMETAGDDQASMNRVYDVLGPEARANLAERARRTSQLQGRQVDPQSMLAAGLFGVAFRPKATRATIVGDRATVDVFGEDPKTEHASVTCVRELKGWRIEPGLPAP